MSATGTAVSTGTSGSGMYMGYSATTLFLVLLLFVVVAMIGSKYYYGSKSQPSTMSVESVGSTPLPEAAEEAPTA